jgi:hypothetical protein
VRASDTRARLLEARDHLSAAFAIIDDVAPQLDEPERGALVGVMGLRHDLARIVRSLGAIAATTERVAS